jgi:hypothetical protein
MNGLAYTHRLIPRIGDALADEGDARTLHHLRFYPQPGAQALPLIDLPAFHAPKSDKRITHRHWRVRPTMLRSHPMLIHRHPINLAKRVWWKISPPSIPSPYLYYPFKGILCSILAEHARASRHAVEFGCCFGYTTSIIAANLPSNGSLTSYDIFARASKDTVQDNLNRSGVATGCV